MNKNENIPSILYINREEIRNFARTNLLETAAWFCGGGISILTSASYVLHISYWKWKGRGRDAEAKKTTTPKQSKCAFYTQH